MKLIGTSTAPSRASANRIAAKACELRERIATCSPAVTPTPRRPAARRLQRRSNSANVQWTSPQTIPILLGLRAAVRRGRSPKVCRQIGFMASSVSQFGLVDDAARVEEIEEAAPGLGPLPRRRRRRAAEDAGGVEERERFGRLARSGSGGAEPPRRRAAIGRAALG